MIRRHYEMFRQRVVPFITSILEQGNGEFLIGNRLTVADVVVTFSLTIAHRLGWLHDCRKIEYYLQRMWAREACKKTLAFYLDMTVLDLKTYLRPVTLREHGLFAPVQVAPQQPGSSFQSPMMQQVYLNQIPPQPQQSSVMYVGSPSPALQSTGVTSSEANTKARQDMQNLHIEDQQAKPRANKFAIQEREEEFNRPVMSGTASHYGTASMPITQSMPAGYAGTSSIMTPGIAQSPFYGSTPSLGQVAVYQQGIPGGGQAAQGLAAGGNAVMPNAQMAATSMGGEFGTDLTPAKTGTHQKLEGNFPFAGTSSDVSSYSVPAGGGTAPVTTTTNSSGGIYQQ